MVRHLLRRRQPALCAGACFRAGCHAALGRRRTPALRTLARAGHHPYLTGQLLPHLSLAALAAAAGGLATWAQPPPLLAAAAFWGTLCSAAKLPCLLIAGIGWRKRLVWHTALQAVLVGGVLRRLPAVCASPLLTHPLPQRQLGALHAALTMGSAWLGAPRALRAARPPPVQCCAGLAALLIMLGFVLPVTLAAAWEQQQHRRYLTPLRSPAAVALEQRWLQQRGGLEAACRCGVLALLLLMLTLTVWDSALVFFQRGG